MHRKQTNDRQTDWQTDGKTLLWPHLTQIHFHIVSSGGAKTKKKAKRICSYCYQVLYRGCRHRCGALRRARNILEQKSELEQERIADIVLKRKMSQCSEEGEEGKVVNLRTFGRPSTYTVTKGRIRKRRKLTYDIIKKAKVAANLSVRQTNKLLAHLRHGLGRAWIVSRIRDQITQANKIFDEEFNAEYVDMEISAQETTVDRQGTSNRRSNLMIMKPHPLVYAKNMITFLKRLCEERSIVDLYGYFLKIGIDDGRGQLKVSLSLVPKSGKVITSELPKFLRDFLETGVKKLLVVATAPAKETATNVKIILDKLNITEWNFSHKIVADLCCINKLIGLGNHKSKFPCYICHWSVTVNKGRNKGAVKRTFRSITGMSPNLKNEFCLDKQWVKFL